MKPRRTRGGILRWILNFAEGIFLILYGLSMLFARHQNPNDRDDMIDARRRRDRQDRLKRRRYRRSGHA